VTGTRNTANTGTAPADGGTAAAAKSGAAKKKRAGAKTSKNAIAAVERAAPTPDAAFDIWSLSTLPQQRRTGYALLILCAASILGIGIWVATDSLHSIGQWAFRATIRGVCVGLMALCLWIVLGQGRTISRVLVIGTGALGLLIVETGTAWWADQARDLANRTLLQLETNRRDVENLTPVEIADPYVEAYVIMRDVYWELSLRSDDEMSRYRAVYEEYTASGAFLDVARLTTMDDLRRSIREIADLQQRLKRVEEVRPDISDLLLTVSLLDVDDDTRAAYADDLRAARDSFAQANLESVAYEQETLQEMRNALEALLDAEGRYRIEGSRLIFDQPEDAARFAGKEIPG